MAPEPLDPSRALLDAVASGIWVTAADGRILDVNPAGAEMLGFAPDELVGRSIIDLCHPDDVPQRARVFSARGGEVIVARRRLRQRDGRWALVEGRARVLGDGRIVTVVHDVTDLDRAERAVRES